jgi:hypothetical protein
MGLSILSDLVADDGRRLEAVPVTPHDARTYSGDRRGACRTR